LKRKKKDKGLTMIELLLVLGIIALLVGLLVPALSAVKTMAKETKQKAQFSTIELALTAFKNDYGDYPPSSDDFGAGSYCGAQTLSEALLGWDLLGFHPRSAWRVDGLDAGGGAGTYDPAQTRDNNGDGVPDTLSERKEPYLDVATTPAFKLYDVFGIEPPVGNTFVICDAFPTKKVVLRGGKTAKAGAPILYYKADTSQKTIRDIYDVDHNVAIVTYKEIADNRRHPLGNGPYPQPFTNQLDFFYGIASARGEFVGYIQDAKVTARPWPYRPDSYILISAGVDGLYGTGDDITNFGK